MYNPNDEMDRIALAEAIEKKLDECKFQREETDPQQELIYSLPVKNTGMFVQVYTSIVGNEVRNVGRDAIRIAGVYRHNGSTKGITADTRVNRVGEIAEIVERMYQRMRNVYSYCNVVEKCSNCGAPMFLSRKGNQVCAAICWSNSKI